MSLNDNVSFVVKVVVETVAKLALFALDMNMSCSE